MPEEIARHIDALKAGRASRLSILREISYIIRKEGGYANVSARPDLRDNRSGPSRGRRAGAARRRSHASAANPHQGAGTSRLAAAARRHAHRRGARPVARARRGRRRLLQFPLCAPRRAVSRAVRGQYRRRDAGRSGVDAAPLRKAVDRARQSLRGRAGQRGRDLLHRHGRPGAVRLGERRDDHRAG